MSDLGTVMALVGVLAVVLGALLWWAVSQPELPEAEAQPEGKE